MIEYFTIHRSTLSVTLQSWPLAKLVYVCNFHHLEGAM